ncbi:FG-GAP-like repeat-containing protein [Frankia sp. R43]|uniref:FG-GAP-like repeat-containing protein n=1 Tax=Frankia sp. R43 TaxID=269536 RepID=UPI0009F86094|nr:FG-GAP-like repeat-containing protein [Frankia sp. R43]
MDGRSQVGPRLRGTLTRIRRIAVGMVVAVALGAGAVHPVAQTPQLSGPNESMVIDGVGPITLAAAPEDLAAGVTPQDIVVEVELGDDVDREALADVVAELNSRQGSLSDAFKQNLLALPTDLPGGAADVGAYPDVDGVVEVTDTVLRVTIPAAEVSTQVSALFHTIAIALGTGLGMVVRAACIGGTAVAGALCAAIGGAIGGFAGQFLVQAIDKKLGTLDGWAKIIVSTVIGAAAGYAWETWVKNWAKDDLPGYFAAIGRTAVKVGKTLAGWWTGGAGLALEDAGLEFQNLAPILERIARDAAGAASVLSGIRLMPVGDSITYGVGSSDDNGYRDELWDSLSPTVLTLDFVGSNSSGTMSDRNHNGWRGAVINEIANVAVADAASMRPNVVTLMAGTNDIQKNQDVAGAPARLGELIDGLRAASPGVAIVVATLVPVKGDTEAQNRRNTYNEAVRSLVADRQDGGQKIMLAEMGPMTDAMMFDRLHPNDAGYDYMAIQFDDAVRAMLEYGWVSNPAAVDGSGGGTGGGAGTCAVPGGGWEALGRIAQGPINPDSSSAGVIGDVRLADFDGNGKTDYAIVTDTGAVYLWTKITDGWENRGKVASGNGVAGRGSQVRFADLDGDHDADYLVLHTNGSVEAWRNDDAWINGSSAWTSKGVVASGTGAAADARVVFADLDGDLDDDYLVVNADGSVDAWRNGDVLVNGKSAWNGLGRIAAGTGNPGLKVRLADLDGDLDADYLVVNSDGSTTAWVNDNVAEDLGAGWDSIGKIAAGTGTGGTAVQFADADADRDVDYFILGTDGTVTWWENDKVATRTDRENGFRSRGTYGNHLADAASNARSVTFADLDGDGDDDYLLVGPKGEVEAWRNDNVAYRGTNAWIKIGRVADGVSPAAGERVVFADIDGDGRDDYLVVNTANGRVRAWRNNNPFTNGITAWAGLGVIAQGPSGAAGNEVQFADIDGDGDDDYLLVAVDHSVRAWKNNGTDVGGGWAAKGVIAQPQGTIAVTERTVFADMNCDDRADYVLRDPGQNNLLHGWFNLGGFDNSWSAKKLVAYGVAMGFPVEVRLADISGDGLDDYLVVDPTNGAVRAWLNRGGNQVDA